MDTNGIRFMIHKTRGNIVQQTDEYWDDDDLRPATAQELVANGFGKFLPEEMRGAGGVVAMGALLAEPEVGVMSKSDLNEYVVTNGLAGSLALNKTKLPVLRATVLDLVKKHNAWIKQQNDKAAQASDALVNAPSPDFKEVADQGADGVVLGTGASGVAYGQMDSATLAAEAAAPTKDPQGNDVV